MASEFETNTLAEIAVLKVAVDRILTHLARSSLDPQSFLATELAQGLENLAKTNYWASRTRIRRRFLRSRKPVTRKLSAISGGADGSWRKRLVRSAKQTIAPSKSPRTFKVSAHVRYGPKADKEQIKKPKANLGFEDELFVTYGRWLYVLFTSVCTRSVVVSMVFCARERSSLACWASASNCLRE
jgi:hypothetical protein